MKILGWLAIALAVGAPRAGAWQQGAAGGRKALVIGNSAYRKVAALKNPRNDVRDLKKALENLHFEVKLVEDAGAAALRDSVGTFTAGLSSRDTAVFYYAGHGMQINGETYLVPVDFEPHGEADATRACYRAEQAREQMEKSGARASILILDACRNNPFAGGGKRMLVFGLAAMDAGLGTLVAYATGPGQTADDNPDERNGLFTKYLLEQMREPLDVLEVFRKAREQVYKVSNHQQRPWIHEDLTDTIYLSQSPPPPAVAKPSPRSTMEDPFRKGQQLYNQGDYQGALAEFKTAVRVDPENAYAHNALGAVYSRLKLYKPAVDSFDQAINLRPAYGAAYYNRGLVYMQFGQNSRYRLALEDFTWAIEQESFDPVLYNLRGKAHFALSEYEEALDDYNRAIQLNPSDAASYQGRARTYQKLGNDGAAAEDQRAAERLSTVRH